MPSSLSQSQQQYPVFEYHAFHIEKQPGRIVFIFEFQTGELQFHPKVAITIPDDVDSDTFDDRKLAVLAFHIGLAEIPSYWKAVCSPTVHIVPGGLSKTQLQFWEKLFINGMGEFFVVNDLLPFSPTITCEASAPMMNEQFTALGKTIPSILIPVGGGKDSVVTLELLKDYEGELSTLMIGNDRASQAVIATYARERTLHYQLHVERTIDPQLLLLNSQGVFNGHTPFSSVAAFLSQACALLFGLDWITVSNERSANEPSVLYHGRPVNHQYSKSFEFEQDFRSYAQESFGGVSRYSSSLRPLYELQVAKIFSTMTQFHSVFRSCNVGQKHNVWCGNCPKCLFVAVLLSAFMESENVVGIFGSDVLNNEKLRGHLENMVSEHAAKPFECVGTREETKLALFLAYKRYDAAKKTQPVLLLPFQVDFSAHGNDYAKNADQLLTSWNSEHTLPEAIETRISYAINS